MTTEALNGPHYNEERVSKVSQFLDQIEQPLRVFIENNGIADMLLDEQRPWDDLKREARLHIGGVESYKFGRTPTTADGWPNISISWRGADDHYYLIGIHSEANVEDTVMWFVVSQDFNGLREERTFQQKEPVNLPMPETDFTQLLQTKYDLLHREAAKL